MNLTIYGCAVDSEVPATQRNVLWQRVGKRLVRRQEEQDPNCQDDTEIEDKVRVKTRLFIYSI